MLPPRSVVIRHYGGELFSKYPLLRYVLFPIPPNKKGGTPCPALNVASRTTSSSINVWSRPRLRSLLLSLRLSCYGSGPFQLKTS